jgi:hypothetical protein
MLHPTSDTQPWYIGAGMMRIECADGHATSVSTREAGPAPRCTHTKPDGTPCGKPTAIIARGPYSFEPAE